MLLGELLASRCLDVEPPRPSAQQKPRPPGCFRLSGRSLWPGCQDSITALGFLQETEEGLALPPTQDPLALVPCWGPMTLGTLDPLTMARNSKNMQTPVSQKRCSMVPPEGPPAPPQRRPRKQPHPCRGTEKGDPTFQGVTLTFELKPDCSLQILPTYSSHSQGPPSSPASAPEPSPGGSEAQAPRCCASCRTQRTPLWRDAEDGTPLCNACGTRNMVPVVPVAGWCPGKVSSPRSCVADVGCPWTPTKTQLRKCKPFFTQVTWFCLSFPRGRMGRTPRSKESQACLLSLPGRVSRLSPQIPCFMRSPPLVQPLLQSGLIGLQIKETVSAVTVVIAVNTLRKPELLRAV
ncbi:ferredoxin-2, mitochondrial, transcript variant X1 [Ictidomys tridecemlineatus]|uniref:GATA-type zinc finger protein 1 isoform X1 n=2 Tax=Ictidomys tridecemlineatus TaxID=43179 RepID=UPI000B53EABB|nr:GATA-type zinc finger protein 1 isoform X1 [Ictidomys tridecemlineatus]KAG3280355.1 ferredoxin-2, mitochondrial, transcript variant X1 [Ictidomys tridecemlineatus]